MTTKLEPIDFARALCMHCRDHGAPRQGSGHDPVGGWVAGWVHRTKDGLIECAASTIWETVRQHEHD